MANDRINAKDESIILGFTAWKTKQEVPLPLAFKLRSEGQLKPRGDLIIFFWRGRKGQTWKKQLLYYRTEHTQHRQQSISQIFGPILTPTDFKRRMIGSTFFSLFLLVEPIHFFRAENMHKVVWYKEHHFSFFFFVSPFLPQPPLNCSLP